MAITANWQYDLNGTTFGPGVTFASGATIAITEITGLDHPDVNVSITNRSNSHGAYASALWRGPRSIVMTGRMNSTAANYGADTYTLKALFRQQASEVLFTWRYPGFGTADQFVYCLPTGVRYTTSNVATAVGWIDFQATMLCPDPRIYKGSTLSSFTLTAGGNSGTATNNGNENAPVIITLNGTGAAGPYTVTNNTTGKAFSYTSTIPNAQSVVADTRLLTVLQGSTSVYSNQGASSVLIDLAPGANSITYAGAIAGTMQWRDTWF